MISDRVAPLGRPIISRIIFPLPCARGLAAFRRDFVSVLACLVAFAAVPGFRFLGEPFLWLATFFDALFCGAPVAPSAVTAAAVSLACSFIIVDLASFRAPFRST